MIDEETGEEIPQEDVEEMIDDIIKHNRTVLGRLAEI